MSLREIHSSNPSSTASHQEIQFQFVLHAHRIALRRGKLKRYAHPNKYQCCRRSAHAAQQADLVYKKCPGVLSRVQPTLTSSSVKLR